MNDKQKKNEMKMTKQFEISKRLAEWLGLKVVGVSEPQYQNTEPMVVILVGECRREIFNPFAPTIEGRAQLAECLIKEICTHITCSEDEVVQELLKGACEDIGILDSSGSIKA